MRTIVLFFAALFSACVAQQKSYEGYELLEIITKDQHDQEIIKFLQQLDESLDFWLESASRVHVFVQPETVEDLKAFLDRHSLEYSVINDHVQRDIEEEQMSLLKRSGRAFDINDFNTFEDISAEMYNMAGRCRSDLGVNCEVFSIGQSYEGRELLVLRMWRNGGSRSGIWIDATIHAREWLGTATHLKIMAHLIDDYATDSQVQQLVDTYDWYLLPVSNPDGYTYTWTDDRMWRKNRSPNTGSICIGTDLNRNYDEEWGVAGASTSACSTTYRGASPASEPETQAVQAEARRIGHTLRTSIHIHTYGQYWLIPWGATEAGGSCKYAADHDEMMAVANPSADAIENTHNTNWLRGNSCDTIYPASGLTMDYFKASGGVKYTVTPELRGTNFVVNADQIQPSFEELWNGITTHIALIP